MLNPIIFKSYDIRGIFLKELSEDAALEIGKSFVKHTGAKEEAVARDARLSGESLFNSLAKGITEAGANVVDIGQLATECLYFAAGFYPEIDAGIMITASHNPKEYNGFKMLRKEGKNLSIIRGKDLLSVIDKDDKKGSVARGQIRQKDILPDFLKHVLAFANLNAIKPIKVVVDASSGVGGLIIPKIAEKIPAEVFLLNYEPDGNFPNHSPNPLEPGSTDQIKKEMQKRKASFGFILDGDADRIFLVDENGFLVRADVTLLLLARYFLELFPGSAVAYNTICSKAVPEFIQKWGGRPVRTPVGFINVREGLLENNGIMGGELSGHYCFRDNFYLDSGMISFLVLLEAISRNYKKVSEISEQLSPYAKSSEINFTVKDKEAVLNKIKEKYSDGQQDYLDGVTVEYNNWWFNVRPSNTEPLLRLTIEADTQDILEQKKKELTDFIDKIDKS